MSRRGGRGALKGILPREEAAIAKDEEKIAGDHVGEDYYIEPPEQFWDDERKFVREILEHNEISYFRLAYKILPRERRPYIERYTDRFNTPPKKHPGLSSIDLEQEYFPEELRPAAFRGNNEDIKSQKSKSLTERSNAIPEKTSSPNLDNIIGLLKIEELEKIDDTLNAGISRKTTNTDDDEKEEEDEFSESEDDDIEQSEEDNDYVEEYGHEDDDIISGGSGDMEGDVY